MKAKLLAFTIVVLALASCTENSRARNYGGTQTVNLPPNTKLINATWKSYESGSSLWYLTRPMRADETAETLTFQEKSSFGLIEGTVNFVESK